MNSNKNADESGRPTRNSTGAPQKPYSFKRNVAHKLLPKKTTDSYEDDSSEPETAGDSWKMQDDSEFDSREISLHSKLHKAVFEADCQTIEKGFSNGTYTKENLNEEVNGNNPLFLAVMLCAPDEENVKKYKIIDLLLKLGSNPLAKNAKGWSLLEIASSIENAYIASTIYKHVRVAKLKQWKVKQATISEHLTCIPDFYLEIKWDFRSKLIPFVSHFMPADTCKIWKMGSSTRLDFSFLGYHKGKAIMSETSILMRERYLINDEYRRVEVAVLDHRNKVLVDPLMALQEDEIEEMVNELISKKPLQSEVSVGQISWNPATTFFGHLKTKNIHGRKAQQHKVNFEMKINTKKLNNCFIEKAYGEYVKDSVERVAEKEETEKKKIGCKLWVSKDFPLEVSQLMTIMQNLSNYNSNFNKLKEYLNHESVQKVLMDYGFPVRVQVPLGYSVDAVATFTEFKWLNPDAEKYLQTFSIPEGYQLLPRKDAFQHAGKSKDTIFANLNI